ncbi:MAG: hypothetical protein HY903_03980 [Deltaproteobacteria bacterium]|nr:hypothetical protein [Deltaproteobacteria bacterium]
MRQPISKACVRLVAALFAAGLASCGKDEPPVDNTPPPPEGTAITAHGAMRVGSVIVNGTRFDDSEATVTFDDAPGRADALGDGMIVKVRGRLLGEDRGRAEIVEVENELRGPIAALGPAPEAFTVLGVKVFADGRTVFANVTGLLALRVGDVVEVHGLRAADGSVRATRVELDEDPATADELRGVITGLTATTFNLGTLAVSYTGAAITPAGTTLAQGMVVEVHGTLAGTTFTAVRVDAEELEDSRFACADEERAEVQGFVSGFTLSPGEFVVDDRAVRTTAATRFEGGMVVDLANGVEIEAQGVVMAGVLIAEAVAFKESTRLEGNVQASTARVVTLFNRDVLVTSLTEIRGGALGAGAGVQIRGFLNNDGVTITATRINVLSSPVQSDRLIIQGLASTADATAETVRVLGFTVDTAAADYMNLADEVVPAATFFAGVVPGRTIVKARGSFAAGILTADEVQLE